MCFHIVDLYRGKLRFRWWLELIITLFASFPRIRLLDDWTHSFTEPVTIHTALGTLDSWSTANVDNQSLSRSVWQDLSAIRGQNHIDPADEKGPGRQIVFLVPYDQIWSTTLFTTKLISCRCRAT